MKTINSYNDLLLEEERLKIEIEISKAKIEAHGKEFIKPKNIFGFLERRVKQSDDHQATDEFEFSKYLVSLSLDYLHDKAGEKILEKASKKSKGFNWVLISKALIDKLYYNNKTAITDALSGIIDKGISKIKK